MHRAKLLNRSGWKRRHLLAGVLVALFTCHFTGNAQQATGSASQVAQRTSVREAAGSATTAISSTKTNQQSQHRVSVAPQGGELEKKTGASPFGIAVIDKATKTLVSCKSWDGVGVAKGCVIAKDASLDEVMTVILKSELEIGERCEKDKRYILDSIRDALNGKR